MNWQKIIAGIGITAGALFLIYKGEYGSAMTLLVGELAFFVGDANGANRVTKATA